ncbi:phosphate acetyltransferase/phosphotransacetylase [Meinhardsimonia xiamenensis]|jgi:phosphate acetyltransferase|uniref:Phosphate acetyltransferase/phosphotransacetylase n=1 Tax=Meinhardsimonia xiamenensis TaxID=990712 RepID=A0A1G9F5T7_9RHOB|nr:phosphate acyltransferase [Meinhardsimonia xiamenensis]PRX37976.1 phosphate acetyltransferase/phosphotransacetylase [Meinhardsimonia xiamenensis]SDK83809.1 phosphate acetyltransferase/phosphotransacetylase [Meinhardsimonia xiamenensis]
MAGVLERAMERARARAARVVFPEAEEPRVAAAIARMQAEGICRPVPLVAEPAEAHVTALAERRGVKPQIARRMLARPLYRAAAMVAAGEAEAMVAGADAPTRRVIEAASMVIGLAPGVSTVSSFFLMLFPGGREMIFADCAVNVAPTAGELADIARATAASARALLGEARVALLSYSTGSSGAGASVEIVRAAAEATGFPGPLQADAALNASIAAKKGAPGGGEANVLIFPSLDAGNIAYKLAQELAGAQAVGPFLQGFARPVCDLSRGARVEDIIAATAVTVAMDAPG